MLLQHSTADLEYDECVGVTNARVHEDRDAALAEIVDRYHAVARRCDAVVILGTDYTGVPSPTEFDFNATIAVNLGAPVLLVLRGSDRTPAEIATNARLTLEELRVEHAHPVGVVANRCDPDALEEILHLLALEGKGGLVGHVLADAAAAALVDGAERLGAAGALFQQLFHAAKGIALFRLDDAHQRAFTGQQTGDKHGHALVAADALRILTEGVAGHFKALVFGEHGGFSFSIRMGLLRMNSPTKC